MEEIHKNLLVEKRVELKTEILCSVADVANVLHSKGIISLDMTDSILSAETKADKAYRLLDLLPSRGSRAFQTFYDATYSCHLWGAADILDPTKAPHETLAASVGHDRNHLALNARPNTSHFQVTGANSMQMDADRIEYVKSIHMYKQALSRESTSPYQLSGGSSFSLSAIQQSPADPIWCSSMGQNIQLLPLPCPDGPKRLANLAISGSESPEDVLTKCQQLISGFKVPLNINDYVTLAALEWKANIEDRKAHHIVKCMASKAKEYFEAKLSELASDCCMTPERAKSRYISLSLQEYSQSHIDCSFFQVWGLNPPAIRGPNILAVNSQEIKFLDIATKRPKENLCWPSNSLSACKKSNDYIYSVILEFQDQTMFTLLSLEFEYIFEELETLMDQNSSRFGF